MIKVSFIAIFYNIEEYVERCLESLLSQTLDEIEIILVDDGSKDNTLLYIKKICSNNKKVKIISQNNKGIDAARKTGYKYANGKYIIFIDGDDWVSDKLAEDLFIMAEVNKKDIICFNFYLAHQDGNKLLYNINECDNIEGTKFLELILKQKMPHNIWNKFLRKEFLDSTSFANEIGFSIGEDIADCILIGIAEPRVMVSKEAYYYYYQRTNSIMTMKTNIILEIVTALGYVENILEGECILLKYKKEVEYLWFIHCYSKIFDCNGKLDESYKLLYKAWRNKKIKVSDNIYCLEFIKKIGTKRRIIKRLFDINYYLGAFYIKFRYIAKRILRKI